MFKLHKLNNHPQKINQDGFVAILTATIITAIIMVVVLGFTVVVRREETQVRDGQLSTQALYASESGVNFAVKADLGDNSLSCKSDPKIDGSANNVAATCILVNRSPNELIFDEISIDRPVVAFMKNSVDELTFAWQDTKGAPNFSNSYPTFFPAPTWGNKVGVLEVVIYPVDTTVTTTAQGFPNKLIDTAKTFYLYPQTGGDCTIPSNCSVSYSDDGKVVKAVCNSSNTPRHCIAKITNIPNGVAIPPLPTLGSQGYVIRLKAIYNPVALQINGRILGNEVALTGVQEVVDSTGKASDVLRRVQIRLPVRPSYNLPTYASETGDDLCKLLNVYPGQDPAYNPDNC